MGYQKERKRLKELSLWYNEQFHTKEWNANKKSRNNGSWKTKK